MNGHKAEIMTSHLTMFVLQQCHFYATFQMCSDITAFRCAFAWLLMQPYFT